MQEDAPELALNFLQDYALLRKAVKRWPREAAVCEREAVQMLLKDVPRSEVVAALAIEQDAKIQEDERRIAGMQTRLGAYARDFAPLRAGWRKSGASLAEQHRELVARALELLEDRS